MCTEISTCGVCVHLWTSSPTSAGPVMTALGKEEQFIELMNQMCRILIGNVCVKVVVVLSAASAEALVSGRKRPPACGEAPPMKRKDVEGKGPLQKVFRLSCHSPLGCVCACMTKYKSACVFHYFTIEASQSSTYIWCVWLCEYGCGCAWSQ